MSTRSNQSFWFSLFNSKLLAAALLVLSVLIIMAVIREKKDKDIGDQAIAALESEIAVLEGKNMELRELLDYLGSQEFIEMEAREKLNMKKPGEKVVIIPRDGKSLVAGGQNMPSRESIPNYLKWYQYFFE